MRKLIVWHLWKVFNGKVASMLFFIPHQYRPRRIVVGSGILLSAVTLLSGCVSIEKHNKLRMTSVSKEQLQPHDDMNGRNVMTYCKERLAQARELKGLLIASKDRDDILTTLNIYNDLLINLDRAASKASLFAQVHPDEKIRKDAETCEQEISRFSTDLSLDKDVFAAIKNGEGKKLDPQAQRLLEHTLRDFRRAGVDKDENTRNSIKKLKEELVKIGQEFGENIRKERMVIKLDNESDLVGLPEDYIKRHKKGPDGKIEISTDYPDYFPFMSYAQNPQHRKELFLKFMNRGQKNGPVLRSMIEKRHELAKLIGYNSFADYIVEDKMIKDAKTIHSFIEQIAQISKGGADKEYAALLEYKKRFAPHATEIESYESSFIEEGLKREKFHFDSQSVRPYFSYNNVLKGMLDITSKLFGITYEPVTDASVWHPSVVTYDVFDNASKIGRIYLDMHPRDGKYQHAAQFTVVSGLKDRQYAEGALVCNFPSPNEGPALMEHRQVITMFHEFGHLLHHIFSGKHDWIPFSGVATEWDFVETPSQFFEELARSPQALAMFARHYKTGELIPAELVNKLKAAHEFGKALFARQQMFYAALSADYYDKDPHSFEPLDLLKTLQARYSYYPYIEGTNFHHNFGHLDGYSAMYYTYMWSLSIAKDLLEPFKVSGLMDVQQAGRFRDTILKQGGVKDAADMVKDFLGRPFKFDAFEQWIKTDPLTIAKQ